MVLLKLLTIGKILKNLTTNQKSKLKKNDIDNGPYHVFGSHDKCDPLVKKNMFTSYMYKMLFL